MVKRQESNDRHFAPIEVIKVDIDRVGRITSRVADRRDLVYFTYRERPDADKPTRTTEYLEGGSWGDRLPRFVKTTPENLAILAAIASDQARIDALERDIDDLRKKYTVPITWAMIEGAK